MTEQAHLAALRRALDQDADVLRRRRTELMELRTALADGASSALQDREIYLVGSIKRIEEQIATLKRVIGHTQA